MLLCGKLYPPAVCANVLPKISGICYCQPPHTRHSNHVCLTCPVWLLSPTSLPRPAACPSDAVKRKPLQMTKQKAHFHLSLTLLLKHLFVWPQQLVFILTATFKLFPFVVCCLLFFPSKTCTNSLRACHYFSQFVCL